ncbi:hypothetical protein VR010_00800 [Actinomycetaceae bacterium L2_0104]
MSTTTSDTHVHINGTMPEQSNAFTGTLDLIRFILRRDRVRFPAWVLGIALGMVYVANALGTVLDEATLQSFAIMASNPIMGLIGGPGYGFEHIDLPKIIVGIYGLYFMLAMALMSILTVSRHTRVEEQTGRAELVRANVTGRHASLTATLVVVAAMNILSSLLVAVTFVASSAQPDSIAAVLLFSASIGAAGLVFAGIAAVTAQLSPFSRAGSAMAGIVLAIAFAIRGLGDMSAVQGGGGTWLSWLSPLGWSQQTAPFVLDRWWPLLFSLALTVVLVFVSYMLLDRRDLGAGIFAERLGSARAPEWLGGALALAYRLQRASITGWAIALFLAGIVFGAFSQPMLEAMDDLPPEIALIMGGSAGVVEGYLGFMGLYFGIMVAVYAILSIQFLRGEEQGLRTEPILSAGVSRSRWLGSWVLVTALGSLLLLVLAGIGTALGAAITGVGDWALYGQTLLGHTIQVAPVWLLLGLAVACYGLAPRLVGLVWLLFGYGMFMSLFGQMLQLGAPLQNLSPFSHVGQYPGEEISWTAFAILVAAAGALVAAGTAGFSRRDLTTA